MEKKAKSGIMLTLLLLASMLWPIVYFVKGMPGETIYIRSDGSVDPPTAPIQRDGDIYTFTDNIYEEIVVERSDIIIDGNGYTLQGLGSGDGFSLNGTEKVTIQNTYIEYWDRGVYLLGADHNTISRNNMTSNYQCGIAFNSSSYNTICANNITDNGYGVWLNSSFNNYFYHNNFIDNTEQVHDYSWDNPEVTPSANTWDDGYPSGGNYWSDYTGVDEKSGPGQDQPESDGIGDTSYYIDENNVDEYPLMNPVGVTYTLTITTTTGGTTDPSPGTHIYRDGASRDVLAIPNTGFYFGHWELDGSWDYSNPITVMMDSDHTLHAVFYYDVTIEAYCHTEGSSVSVSIAMDGSPTGFSTPHTFAGLTGTHTFTVPNMDPSGHQFKHWDTCEPSTTILVTSGGTYTACYLRGGWGPIIEHIRYPTYLSPAAQTAAMQRRDVEFLTDLMQPMYIEMLRAAGRKVYGTPCDHFCCIAFNLKCWWLGPMDGSESPGRALRHATAHLVPKDELIGTLFKYTATKIEAPGPPAQGEWYNSNVDPHTYDPVMAYNVLTTGGWTWDAGDGRWELAVPFEGYPAGTPMPTTTLYSPEFMTAPTSWEIVRTTVARMTGAAPFDTKPLPAVHEPIDFNVLLDILDFEPRRSQTHDEGGWDAYFGCYSNLGRTARFLFSLHHSSQDIEEGDNTMHLHNDPLDAQLHTINTSLDHIAKVAAAQEAYRLLMGSPGLQYTPTTDGIIARIPIYSRVHYVAVDEGLSGIVELLLTGVDNRYTFANMYWADSTGHGSDIVDGFSTKQLGYMVKFCNHEPLQTPLNPAYASSPYTWMVMDRLYDTLIRTNPYTNRDYAWILDETKDPDYPNTPGFYLEPWGDGMKVTYWMVDDTILWHDGHPIDAFDIEFAWEFQKQYQIGKWWETFMYFDHADVIDVPYNRTIAAYFTETSQFTPSTLASMALMFPEHIWGCTHERNGRATPSCVYAWQDAEMYDGTPVTVESGICGCSAGPAETAPVKTTCIHGSGCVIDHPATVPNEVYAYDPSYYAHPNPPTAFPWLTELVGTGEFVFYNYNPTAMVSDIVAFDSTRTGAPGALPDIHYWKTTAQLAANLADMFWEAGDCDRNGKIDGGDQIIMADAMGYWYPHPYYDARADITCDGFVGIHDAVRFGKNFGKLREYPGCKG